VQNCTLIFAFQALKDHKIFIIEYTLNTRKSLQRAHSAGRHNVLEVTTDKKKRKKKEKAG